MSRSIMDSEFGNYRMTNEELIQEIQKALDDGRDRLDLRWNNLKSLPPEIGQLKNLKTLLLNANQLTTLPAEISRLTNLERLYLGNNQLTTLPAQISRLSNLKSLDISSNQFSHLPEEVFQLPRLEDSLQADYNDLVGLPSQIGKMTNLRTLHLSNNQLSELPAQIRWLTNLKYLYLGNNQISALPPEIGCLTHLHYLSLDDNQLETLPNEIGRLTKLRFLYLMGNQLRKLPPQITLLSNLERLDLRDNPIPIPSEILEEPENFTEILNFYFPVQDDSTEAEPLYEAKLVILGEAGVGKTSLAQKIKSETYELKLDEKSTEGIDVIHWEFQLSEGQPFRVNIWDFGGQEIYHKTHQFFLTAHSLYFLVVDHTDNTDLQYWLRVIELLSDGSPIFIIKNEKQERSCEINERQWRGEFLDLKGALVTNLFTNRGLAEIKDTIQTHITRLPDVGTSLPKPWVRVRAALENDIRNTITQDEYLQLCRANNLTDKDALFLSCRLHYLGVCLHFQKDAILKHILILKPEWATNAVYKILDTSIIKQNRGCFNQQDLDTIWQETEYANYQDELLHLMMSFKLCYEIPGHPHHYIAPHLLSADQPEYDWDYLTNLIRRYEYSFMPKGILTRFIIELHRYIENQTLVWKNGVILDYSNGRARAEILENYSPSRGEIRIRVSGNDRKELLSIINHEFEKIHKSYERLQYNIWIPCNCGTCSDLHEPCEYTLDELQYFRDNHASIQCRKSLKLINVHQLMDDVLPRTLSNQNPKRDRVFISYSHKDVDFLNQLKTHLQPLIREDGLKIWDDSHIEAGTEWRKEIGEAIASAKVAVLLVSSDFLASDFIARDELPPLLNAAQDGGLTILWIPIRPSLYKHTEIEQYQAAHPPDKPIISLLKSDKDQAWVNICHQIHSAAQK